MATCLTRSWLSCPVISRTFRWSVSTTPCIPVSCGDGEAGVEVGVGVSIAVGLDVAVGGVVLRVGTVVAGVSVWVEEGVLAGVTTGTAVEASGARVSGVILERTGTVVTGGEDEGNGTPGAVAQATRKTTPIIRVINRVFVLIEVVTLYY
jgi:hypothetical protein